MQINQQQQQKTEKTNKKLPSSSSEVSGPFPGRDNAISTYFNIRNDLNRIRLRGYEDSLYGATMKRTIFQSWVSAAHQTLPLPFSPIYSNR